MFTVGKLRIAPSICFRKRSRPHCPPRPGQPPAIARPRAECPREPDQRRLVLGIERAGYGTWPAGRVRAVECRMPLLIAANTGFSAWIDGDGRICAEGPRLRRWKW